MSIYWKRLLSIILTILLSAACVVRLSAEMERVIMTDDIINMVVPTLKTGCYDFMIDVEGLLAEYSPNLYEEGHSVYFADYASAPKLLLPDMGDGYELGFAAEEYSMIAANGDLFCGIMEGHTLEAALFEIGGGDGCYIFLMDEDAAYGSMIKLTKDNFDEYFEYTLDENGVIVEGTLEPINLVKKDTVIWDSNLYIKDYTDITGEVAAEKYLVGDRLLDGLYVKVLDENNVEADVQYYKAVLTEPKEDELLVSIAEREVVYRGASESFRVVNKSAADVVVVAEINIINASGLRFCESDVFEPAAGACLYMAVADENGNIKSYVSEDDKRAVASCFLRGMGTDAVMIYNDVVTGGVIDIVTGDNIQSIATQVSEAKEVVSGSSIQCYQYLVPDFVYEDAVFTITAEANIDDAIRDEWNTYIEGLQNGSYERPSIEVVYRFVKVSEVDAGVYEDENGNIYTLGNEGNWTDCKSVHNE